MSAEIIQFVPKGTSNIRSAQELREIGLRIITSPEFQELHNNEKLSVETDGYDPVAIAIMRGFYYKSE